MTYCHWQPDVEKTRCSVCGFKLNKPFGPDLPLKTCTPGKLRPMVKIEIDPSADKAKRRSALVKTLDGLLVVDDALEGPKRTVGETEVMRRLAICDACASFTGLKCKTLCPDCHGQAGIKMAKILLGLSTITPGVPDLPPCPKFTEHL